MLMSREVTMVMMMMVVMIFPLTPFQELLEPLLRLVMLKFKGKQGEGQQPDAQQLCGRATELFHVLCKQRVCICCKQTSQFSISRQISVCSTEENIQNCI